MNKIDQLHRACPSTYTPERLAVWIKENQKSIRTHVDKIPLTPEEVSDLEHKSSLASRAIDRLEEVMDEFKAYIQGGTPYDGEKYLPKDITIPPSKGMKELKANRAHSDSILVKGYNEEITEIYIVPFPDESTMVAMDITGCEWPDYTKAMTESEEELYGRLFVKDKDGNMQQIENADMRVDRDGTAKIKVPKKEKEKKEPEQFI